WKTSLKFQANESLVFAFELNEFAQLAAEILNKSDSQNELSVVNESKVLLPTTKQFINRHFGESALPNIFPRVNHDSLNNALATFLSVANQTRMDEIFPTFIGFTNESMLEDFAKRADRENITVIAGIVFDDVGERNKSLGPVVSYKIRQKPAFTPSTEAARDVLAVYAGPRDWDDSYYSYGFLWLQDVIERSIISVMVDLPIVEPGAGMIEMAFPCFRYDRFLINMQTVILVILALSYLCTLSFLVDDIVYQKEHGLTEVRQSYELCKNSSLKLWNMCAAILDDALHGRRHFRNMALVDYFNSSSGEFERTDGLTSLHRRKECDE
ncbi:hypothetical protein NECAME_06499, partial [Necator americanus]